MKRGLNFLHEKLLVQGNNVFSLSNTPRPIGKQIFLFMSYKGMRHSLL